jgi:hypothetical protein
VSQVRPSWRNRDPLTCSNPARRDDVPAGAASCPPGRPRDTGPVLLAHADGFSWDEALMVLAPIAILAGILLYVNTKLQRGLGDADPDDGTGDAEPALDDVTPASDPSTPT